jgi:hypothetical protein
MPVCCGEAEQQDCFSAQHFMSAWQQPALASVEQQALPGLQQAAFAEQQSFAFSPAPRTLENNRPRPTTEPRSNLAIMVFSRLNMSKHRRAQQVRSE